jgi:DNA (cytosine-5)-methyltransferase 1
MVSLLYIDLFCGAGGTSTGVESAKYNNEKCAKVIACVNHDAKAIASHAANHPEALHFTEDIRTLELSPLIAHIEKVKAQCPDALIVLWASLECTNFSKAKGGKPRNADSRTLGKHLYRYIEAINPDYVQVENVEEFTTHSWAKTPIVKDSSDFLQWVKRIEAYGYKFDYRMLNAADYGAYTSRKRFFGQFAKHKLPIKFPEPTHAKNQALTQSGQQLKRWKPVKEVLDFTDEGESIFTRKKALSNRTLERIYAGLIKFVAGGKNSFLLKFHNEHPESKNAPASATFIARYNGQPKQDVNAVSVEVPAPTLTVKDRLSLVSTHFIMSNYSNGHNCNSVDNPCSAIVKNPKQNVISCTLPSYLITAATGQIAAKAYEADSEPMRKIKQFVALYRVVDIKMRMLRISELKQIMGLPKDYTLIGTQEDQKKYIGNAVEVNMARVLCEALVVELYKARIFKVAA